MAVPTHNTSGVRLAAAASSVVLASPPASTAETAIVTTPTLSPPLDNAAVLIQWYWQGVWGTGTTAVNVNLRRGSGTAGTLINNGGGITVTAGNQFIISGCYVDTPGAVAGMQYTLTLTGQGTTGAGSSVEGCMMAFVL